MRLILHEVAERFLNVERGWLRTARELCVDPGGMIRSYVHGRHGVYANPFAYLVAGTAVSIIVQGLFGFHGEIVATARATTMDSPLKMEVLNRFTELMFQNILYVSLGILVPLALLLRLFFRRSGYNLAESFVFVLYTAGHMALLGLVLFPLYALLPRSAAVQGFLAAAVAVPYSVYAARAFFKGRFLAVAIKTVVAIVMAYLTFILVMTVCVLAYVFVVIVPASTDQTWDLVTATDYDATLVVERLLDEGADVNMTVQRTALHAAAENGNLEIVDLLIGHGADVNLTDIHGRVPMFVALVKGQPEIARRLADAGTDATVRTADGTTLLMAALKAGNAELARWALENGVDVNAQRPTKDLSTALMIAARHGNLPMVDLLLANGADPGAANHQGRTTVDLAKGQEVKARLRTATRRTTSTPEEAANEAGKGHD